MTTLADINQTLMVQNEMQEKTTKAVDSLTKRFAAFLRVSKGDNLEDLESRREARRQSRAMGFAGRAKGAASAVKNNIGLISKILGGLALGAFVLQNEELRAAVMDFITTAGQGIAAFFRSDEFREILGATFSAAGNVFTSLLGTVWETDGGKKMLIGLGVALAAIFAGPAVIAAIAGALATAALKLPGQAIRTVTGTGRGSVVEQRGARANAIAEQRRLNTANAAQQRFNQNQRNFAPKSVRPTYPAPDEFFKQRGRLPGLGGLTRLLGPASLVLGGVTGLADREAQEAGIDAPSRAALGLGQLVPGTLDTAQFIGTELLNQAVPLPGPGLGDMVSMGYDALLQKMGLPGLPGVSAPTATEAYRDFAIPALADAKEKEEQRRRNQQMNFYLDRIVRMGAADGRHYIPPSQNSIEYDELMRQHLMFQEARTRGLAASPQSKIPALSQAMDGAGTGAPIVVPVPIPMDAGKGPGPVVSQGTVGGSLSAGETIHLNQDPATIIGGVPRQQSGGGGGW